MPYPVHPGYQPCPEPTNRSPDHIRPVHDPDLGQLGEATAGAGESSASAIDALDRFLTARQERISVERLERDDGALIVYIDAVDIVIFVYVGHGDNADAVVLDLHHRADAGEQRLHLLVDGVRARLLTLDTPQFRLRPATAGGKPALTCVRCGRPLLTIHHAPTLQHLLDAASSHRCRPLLGRPTARPDGPGDESRETPWS